MVDESTGQSSFVDQIVEKAMEALSGLKEFDEAALRRIGELAKAKGLSDYASVVDALASGGEE